MKFTAKKIIIWAYLIIGMFFLPFYLYVAISGLYILGDTAYWYFRMNQNKRGIVSVLAFMALLLITYFMMIAETLTKGLQHIQFNF